MKMKCFNPKYVYAAIVAGFIGTAALFSNNGWAQGYGDYQPPTDPLTGEQSFVTIEIERDTPDEKQHIVRHFEDLETLLWWFEDKVNNGGCDPYVTSIKMYPAGR